MTTPIIIREKQKNKEGFAATVQFESGAPYDITVSDPFSEQEEKRLEWYFEQWLNFPFTDKVTANEAAASIRAYGEALFEQVFRRDPDVYLEYQRLRQGDFILEIAGSPEFHALHWEALQDPNQARPLAVDKLVVRKNMEPVTYRAELQPAPHLRVLLVTARPAGVRDVSYRTVSRPLIEALETSQVATQIDIVRPNIDAALWFGQQVLPFIQAERPHTTFAIVGQRPHPRLDVLRDKPGVAITGYVDDVRTYIADATVYVAPLRVGGGTRLKLLEAMAMQKAIVSTTVGAEGFPVVNGQELLLADEPASFAKEVLSLLADTLRREKLAAAGRAFAQANYGWGMLVPQLEKVYQQNYHRRMTTNR